MMLYRELVGSLPLDCIGLEFWRSTYDTWQPLMYASIITVEDLLEAHSIDATGNPFTPHFGIPGYLNGSPIGKPQFYISCDGPHILYLTRVPNNNPPKYGKSPYHLKDAFWKGYWEDNQNGYLFQITQNSNY